MNRDTQRFLKLKWPKPAIRDSRNTLDRLIFLYDGSWVRKCAKQISQFFQISSWRKEGRGGGNWTVKKPLGIVKNRLPRGGERRKEQGAKSRKKKGGEKKEKKIHKNGIYIGIQWPRLNCRFSGGLKWRSGQEWENSSKPNPGFCSRTVEPANPLKKYGYILYHFPSCHLTSPPDHLFPLFCRCTHFFL